mgnify:CR=1 FL=1
MSSFVCSRDQNLSGNLSAMPVGRLVKNLRWFKAGVPREYKCPVCSGLHLCFSPCWKIGQSDVYML